MRVARFTAQFKAEAIKQVLDRGHSVQDVANRLGYQIRVCTCGCVKPKTSKVPPVVI